MGSGLIYSIIPCLPVPGQHGGKGTFQSQQPSTVGRAAGPEGMGCSGHSSGAAVCQSVLAVLSLQHCMPMAGGDGSTQAAEQAVLQGPTACRTNNRDRNKHG